MRISRSTASRTPYRARRPRQKAGAWVPKNAARRKMKAAPCSGRKPANSKTRGLYLWSRKQSPHFTPVIISRSRRRGRQDLLVLRAVFLVPLAGGDEDEVVVHLVAAENLAELGDEQPFLQVTRELRQPLDIFC